MPFSVELIRKLEKVSPELKEILLALLEEVERQREESVTRREFLEFARQTEENFQKVWQSIKELAEAQKQTEQRVNKLAEAQRKTEIEMAELRATVKELTEAQKKTEQRVNELAEAQRKTEQRLNELAEAQKKTEEEVRSLAKELKDTKKMVGGLSDTVGYGLEDRIFPYIKNFAKKEYGIKVEVLDRRNIVYPDGRYDEANIYVEGKRNGKKVYLIGECKARPSKKNIKDFVSALQRIKKHLGGEVEGFMVGAYYSPEVEEYIKKGEFDIKFMKSFEFELNYSGKN